MFIHLFLLGGSTAVPDSATTLESPAVITFDAQSHVEPGCDPSDFPPIGVMGAHFHHAGEWMLSTRYTYQRMEGLRDGTSSVSSTDVFGQGFMQSTKSMTMEMFDVEAMYGISDELSLMVTVPYVEQSMKSVDSLGEDFTTRSSGFGDVSLAAAYALKFGSARRGIASLGVSLPTGSTDERDDMPGCPDCKLEYMMQNGSGTYEMLPSFAYVAGTGDWSFGAQALARIRMGRNDDHYRLGDRGEVNAWVGRQWTEAVRTSLRLEGSAWGNVEGQDPEIDPAMSPTNDPDRQGGRRIDAALGADWFSPEGRFAGSGLGIEAGIPVYQDLDGPQPDLDWFLSVGLRFVF